MNIIYRQVLQRGKSIVWLPLCYGRKYFLASKEIL